MLSSPFSNGDGGGDSIRLNVSGVLYSLNSFSFTNFNSKMINFIKVTASNKI